MNLLTPFLGIVSNYIIVRHAKRFILFSKSSDCIIKNLIVKTMNPRWTKMLLSKEKAPWLSSRSFSDWNVNDRSRKNAYQSYSIHMTALQNMRTAFLSVKSLPKFRESRCFFCQADSNNNQAGFRAALKNCLPNDWPSAYCPENKYPHRKLWRYLWQKSEPRSYNAIWQYIVPLDVASNTKEDWK